MQVFCLPVFNLLPYITKLNPSNSDPQICSEKWQRGANVEKTHHRGDICSLFVKHRLLFWYGTHFVSAAGIGASWWANSGNFFNRILKRSNQYQGIIFNNYHLQITMSLLVIIKTQNFHLFARFHDLVVTTGEHFQIFNKSQFPFKQLSFYTYKIIC